jgi:hypothetical protein
MKIQAFWLAGLLAVSSQVVVAESFRDRSGNPQNRIPDGVGVKQSVAGVFERYDSGRKIARISGVDYDLDPSALSLAGTLSELRSGQNVLFTQGGTSPTKRNVLTSIQTK